MIHAFEALVSVLLFIAAHDIWRVYENGRAYRELKAKKDKTQVEASCVEQASKFFEVRLWHKATILTACVLVMMRAAE